MKFFKSKMSQKLLVAFSILIVSGCEYTLLAEPTIVHAEKKNIEVQYLSAGVKTVHNQQNALQLIDGYCKNGYQIVGRTSNGANNFIDAKCD